MHTWAEHLTNFYGNLQPPHKLPHGISWLHPQQSGEVAELAARFFRKFFNDAAPRTLLLGINPGRFGAGVTGVNFTAAKQLTQFCGIEHDLRMQSELSAEFIYDVKPAKAAFLWCKRGQVLVHRRCQEPYVFSRFKRKAPLF
jgi:hypothetical protein